MDERDIKLLCKGILSRAKREGGKVTLSKDDEIALDILVRVASIKIEGLDKFQDDKGDI